MDDSEDMKKLQTREVKEQDLFPETDITGKNAEAVQRFIDEGLPRVISPDHSTYHKMVEMYMSNQTYSQIASATRSPKAMVMFLSKKYNWFAHKQAYLMELEEGMKRRVIEDLLVSQDFRLQLVQMWHKKLGKKLSKYFSTNNEEHLDLDLKELDRYLKVVDSLKESIQPPKSSGQGSPTVGLNLGDGVTITKKGDNEVEITPKQKAIGDILQEYADMKRQEEENAKKGN